MNILFHFYRPIVPHIGGVQRVTDILSKEFTRRGHNVFFLSLKTDKEEELSYPYIYSQYFIDFDDKDTVKTAITELLKSNSIDIIISQIELNRHLDTVLLFNSAGIQTKKISFYHNTPFIFKGNIRRSSLAMNPTNLKYSLLKLFGILFPKIKENAKLRQTTRRYKEVMDASTVFCLLSDKFFPEFVEEMKLKDYSKLRAVNNPNTFSIKEIDDNYLHKENIILFVGRVVESKGVYDFVNIWKNLYKDNPSWKAVMVGNGPELENVKAYASKLNIHNICFEGRQSDVASYYKRAKILCLPSAYEGWGMVLTEGMAYGAIPIAYDTFASVHDIIDNGVSGFVTKPFAPNEMVEKIQFLIDNPDMMQKMADSAKLKIEEFDATNIGDKWDELFDSI